jgi:hypothetical protein
VPSDPGGRESRSSPWDRRPVAASSCGPPRAGFAPIAWSSPQAPTRVRTGRQGPARCRPTCCRSTWMASGIPGPSRPAACSWSAATSPAARSPRSCTRQVAKWCSRAAGHRGLLVAWEGRTSSGGPSSQASWISRWPSCLRPPSGPSRTSHRRAMGAGMTFIYGRSARWASPSAATSWAQRTVDSGSLPTWGRTWRGETSAIGRLWTWSARWLPSEACRRPRSRTRSHSTHVRPRNSR